MVINQSFSNHLNTLQNFINDHCSQIDNFVVIQENIEVLQESLNHKNKLILQVLGTSPQQINTFEQLISEHLEIQKRYDVRTSLLPQLPEPNTPVSFPALVLQNDPQSSIRYELDSLQTLIIGRNPTVAQIVLPDNLSLTSGNHAQLQLLPENKWQIKDSDSMNGTFINGSSQKNQDWYTLESGDQICLGSDSQAPESATLIFEVPPEPEIHPVYLEANKLLQCHVICLIVPPQSLSDNLQRFLQLVKEANIPRMIVIVERASHIDCQSFQSTLNQVRDCFNSQVPDISFQFHSLLLNPFVPDADATMIVPQSQGDFDKFTDDLINLSTEQYLEIMTQFRTHQLERIIEQTENLLLKKQSQLKDKIDKDEQYYYQLSPSNLKKEIDKVCRQVDKERDLFLKQVKSELVQSKAYLLDEFRQKSISTQIVNFSQHLQVEINDEKGFRYVSLIIPMSEQQPNELLSVHHQAINFCHLELEQWIQEQWDKICYEYEDGGLTSLWEKAYDSLDLIPEIELPQDKFSLSQNLETEKILSMSTIDQNFVVKYKQVSFLGYMLKNVKGQIISLGGLLGMISGGVFSKGILIPILLPIVVIILWLSYKQDKQLKVEESIEKLQKDVANYYQSYVKAVIDRLIQHIEKLLELEDRNLRFILDEVKEIYGTYLNELDATQKQLKVQIEEMKRHNLKQIEKSITDFQKLKQSITTINSR